MSDSTPNSGLDKGATTPIQEITPRELSRAKRLPLIVDVREAEEYVRGHISGARHISRSVLEAKVAELVPDPATPIVVYCAGGNRAALAADTLNRLGYRNVRSLSGGLRRWLESGGLVETPHSFLNRGRKRSG